MDAESLHALKRTVSDCYPRCTRDKRKRIPNVEQFFNWGHVLGLRVQQVVDMLQRSCSLILWLRILTIVKSLQLQCNRKIPVKVISVK